MMSNIESSNSRLSSGLGDLACFEAITGLFWPPLATLILIVNGSPAVLETAKLDLDGLFLSLDLRFLDLRILVDSKFRYSGSEKILDEPINIR